MRRNRRFIIPLPVPNEVERKALLQRIRQAEDRQIVVLSGPAMYGKTTLLAQYARSLTSSPCWVSLTLDDGDPLSLGHSIAATVRAYLGVAFPEWDKYSILNVGNDRRASALASDLNDSPENITLILDQANHLTSDSGRFLIALLSHLGEGHRVLLAVHEGTPIDLSRHLANGSALSINIADLAFDRNETCRLLKSFRAAHDPAVVQQSLEGWPGGTAIVAHGVPLAIAPKDLLNHALECLPEDVRAAIPEAAALLESWSESESRALGLSLPAGWIQEARRAGLPMAPLGEPGTYRPHQVLLEALETRLLRAPARHDELHDRAARRALAAGKPLAALTHWRLAQKLDEALQLADDIVRRYEQRSDYLLAREMLEPFALADLTPRLRSVLGLALIETGQIERGGEILETEVRTGTATGLTYFALSILYYRQDQYQATIQIAEKGLGITTDLRERVQLLRAKATGIALLGSIEEALSTSMEAVKLARSLGDPGLQIAALSVYAFALRKARRTEEAVEILEQLLQTTFDAELPHRAMPVVQQLVPALIAKGRYAEAESISRRLAKIAEATYPLASHTAATSLSHVFTAQNQYAEAVECLQTALNEDVCRFYTGTSDVQYIQYLIAFNLLMLKQIDHASIHIDKVSALHRESTDPYSAYMMPQLLSFRALLHGDCITAAKEAEEVLQVYEDSDENPLNKDDALYASLTKAEAARRQGNLQFSHAEEVVLQLDKCETDNYLRTVLPLFENLYREFCKMGWSSERYAPYIGLSPQESTTTRPVLYLRLCGQPEVEYDGSRVDFRSFYAKLTIAIFHLRGPQSQDSIGQSNWPNKSAKEQRDSTYNIIRNIKISFEKSNPGLPAPMISLDKRTQNKKYYLSPQIEIVSDVQLLKSADIEDIDWVLETYGVGLLPESDLEWVQEERHELAKHVYDLTMEAAKTHDASAPHRALELYRKAAKVLISEESAFEAIQRVSLRINDKETALLASRALDTLRRCELPWFFFRTLV